MDPLNPLVIKGQGRFGQPGSSLEPMNPGIEDTSLDLSAFSTRGRHREEVFEPVRHDSILPLRQALIFAAKLSRADRKNYDVKKASPICYQAADVGTLLTVARMPREVVVAGFLHQALKGLDGEELAARRAIIERKFIHKSKLGSEVLTLVDAVSPPGEEDLSVAKREASQLERAQTHGPKFAALFCAVKCADLLHERGVSAKFLGSLDYVFREQGVPPLLRDQFRIAAAKAAPDSEFVSMGLGADKLDSPLNVRDVLFIRHGMQLSSKFFAREARRRGLEETVPLNSHSFEVGYLLLTAGCDKELVVAGNCHDFEEQYVIRANVEKLREFIGKKFGPRVLRLIRAVSEPPKTDLQTGWLERKQSVIEKIQRGESDEATLCCAAKISTFGNGNKWLKASLKAGETDVERATLGWTKGNHAQNVEYGHRLLEVFEQKGVPATLLRQYHFEMKRFERFGDLYARVNS